MTVPIITTTTATVPGTGSSFGSPASGGRTPTHAVARLERADPREEVEVDGEPLAAPRPRLGAPDRLRGERDHRVAERGADQRARHRVPLPDQLDPREDQQHGGGRPAAEPLRVGARRRRPAAEHRAGRAADRPPRAERAEHVAEEQRHEDEPDPEDDQDEGGGEVVGARVHAGVAADDRQHEQRHADRPAEDLDGAAAEEAPARERPPRGVLQLRLRPQHRQRAERDDEHGGRRPRRTASPGSAGSGARSARCGRTPRPAPPARRRATTAATRIERMRLQGGLERVLEGRQPERALQARGDLALGVDHEQPRLGPQVERLQRRPQTRVRVVVRVDLLVDELDLVAVLGLELQRDVGDRAADARLAELRRREQQRDGLLADAPCRTSPCACRSAARACRAASRCP